MKGHLIQIDARDGSGAATRYLASADHPSLCHLNGQQWVPAIARLPSLRYDFFGGDFNGAITSPSASFSAAIEGISTFTAMRWAGARVRLYTGNIGDAWGSFTLRFDGRINAEPTLGEGIANFEAGPDDSWLDKPLLTLFAGSGGVEGPTDLTGVPKPLALGASRFAPGVLVDATNTIYTVSAYAVQGITAAYDRVVSLGASTGDYASLAALIAAVIPSGGWGTCKALGLVRLGAPADGQISFDISGDNAGAVGYARKPGAMIRRIAEIAGGTVDTANLTALDTARPYNLVRVLSAQTTAREAIQNIADSVCAVAGVTQAGTLFAAPLGYTASSQTLKSDGTALPPVASVEVKPVAAPFWRLATEAEPTWVVHDSGNVASEYNLRGLYSATRVYRLDDVVESADGSAWLYINATAGAGNAPPTWPTTSNTYWTTVNPATAASWSLVANDNGAKASDYAGTTLLLSALGTIAPTFQGNTAVRAGGSDGFVSAALHPVPFKGTAFVAAAIVQTSGKYTMVALDDDTTTYVRDGGTGFRAYAQYQASSGLWEIWINGALSTSGTAATGITGLLRIVYDGVNFTVHAGTTQLGQIATTAAQTLYAKWALYDAAITLTGLQAGFMTDNAASTTIYASGATVESLKPGEASSDITGTVTGAPTLTILCDYTGAVKTGQLTATSSYKLSKAGTDVTATAAWSVTTLTGTCTVSIGAATGVLSLSAISTNCRVRIDAAYGGKTYSTTINLERQLDNAPTGGSPGGGTTASVAINGSVNSTTHAAITASDLYVKAGTNGQVALDASGGFYHSTTDFSLHVYTIIQKWNGSAFVDLGTQAQSGQPSTYVSAESAWEDGVFSSTHTDTSLTAGVEYRYRVTGRTFSGTVARYFSGTLTGVGT